MFKIYQDVLARRPYLVQAVQTGALMGAGDLISQTFIEKQSPDFIRTLRFSSIGFFICVSILFVNNINITLHLCKKTRTLTYTLHVSDKNCFIYFFKSVTNLKNSMYGNGLHIQFSCVAMAQLGTKTSIYSIGKQFRFGNINRESINKAYLFVLYLVTRVNSFLFK